jgi:hypothetical protein
VLRFNHILCFCNSFLRQIQCNFFFWQYIFFSTCSTVQLFFSLLCVQM